MLTAKQQQLIEDNYSLIYSVIKRMSPFDYEEDVASGELGLCKASLRYNEALGKFSTYAYKIIRNEIIRNRKKNSIKTVSLNDNKTQEELDCMIINAYESEHASNNEIINLLLYKFPNYSDIIIMLSKGSTYAEIARSLGVTRQNIDRILSIMRNYLTEIKGVDKP
jgi:RNA polymerase sigma factor (sigma-70 family)